MAMCSPLLSVTAAAGGGEGTVGDERDLEAVAPSRNGGRGEARQIQVTRGGGGVGTLQGYIDRGAMRPDRKHDDLNF
jgi:hypothetical protein